MKALELADAYADACFDQALNGRTEDPIPEQKRDELAAELRRLAAVESDCAPYLKEGETPAERIKRALGDADSLMNLYRDVIAERDALKAKFENTLAECRDAYPAPEVGSELEGLWGRAMSNPASVGAYVKACATSQKKEIDALKAERDELRATEAAWRKLNDTLLHQVLCCGVAASHPDATLTTREAYAGKWNSKQAEAVRALRADRDSLRAELERIKALEPVAYARFADNGNIRIWARTHAEAIAGNLPEAPPMTPLYALGSKTA